MLRKHWICGSKQTIVRRLGRGGIGWTVTRVMQRRMACFIVLPAQRNPGQTGEGSVAGDTAWARRLASHGRRVDWMMQMTRGVVLPDSCLI